MFKKTIIFLLMGIQTIFLLGCASTNNNPLPPEEVCPQGDLITEEGFPLVVLKKGDGIKELSERKTIFQNSLEMSIKIDLGDSKISSNTQNNVPYLKIYINYKNTSLQDIVLRNPEVIGFLRESIATTDNGAYDLGVRLYTNQELPVTIPSDYGYLDEYKISLDDFLIIESGETFCKAIKLQMPLVYIGGIKYANLPSGKYLMYAEYQNYLIGNTLPFLETPLPNMSGIKKTEWDLQHQRQRDLNAWVGKIESKLVEFIVP